MKIAILAERMLLGYGVDMVVHQLSSQLTKLGYTVDVFVTRCDIISHEYDMFIVQPMHLPCLNRFWQEHLFVDARASIPMLKQLRHYDLIVTHDPMHLFAAFAKIARITPVIMHHHGMVPLKVLPNILFKLQSAYASLSWKFYFTLADRIFVCSYFVKNTLPNWARAKAIVNYNGVEHMKYQGKVEHLENFRKSLEVDAPLILWVGRLSSPYKGAQKVINMYKILAQKTPNVKLLMVGRGTEEEARLLQRFRGVVVVRNASQEELKKCYAACDVFVSTSYWEGFNLPLAEAQANGKPVVAYRTGAHPEIVKHGKTGFLAKNDEEFIESVLTLLADDHFRKSMGKEAAEHSLKFNWHSHTKIFQKVVENLV